MDTALKGSNEVRITYDGEHNHDPERFGLEDVVVIAQVKGQEERAMRGGRTGPSAVAAAVAAAAAAGSGSSGACISAFPASSAAPYFTVGTGGGRAPREGSRGGEGPRGAPGVGGREGALEGPPLTRVISPGPDSEGRRPKYRRVTDRAEWGPGGSESVTPWEGARAHHSGGGYTAGGHEEEGDTGRAAYAPSAPGSGLPQPREYQTLAHPREIFQGRIPMVVRHAAGGNLEAGWGSQEGVQGEAEAKEGAREEQQQGPGKRLRQRQKDPIAVHQEKSRAQLLRIQPQDDDPRAAQNWSPGGPHSDPYEQTHEHSRGGRDSGRAAAHPGAGPPEAGNDRGRPAAFQWPAARDRKARGMDLDLRL